MEKDIYLGCDLEGNPISKTKIGSDRTSVSLRLNPYCSNNVERNGHEKKPWDKLLLVNILLGCERKLFLVYG